MGHPGNESADAVASRQYSVAMFVEPEQSQGVLQKLGSSKSAIELRKVLAGQAFFYYLPDVSCGNDTTDFRHICESHGHDHSGSDGGAHHGGYGGHDIGVHGGQTLAAWRTFWRSLTCLFGALHFSLDLEC